MRPPRKISTRGANQVFNHPPEHASLNRASKPSPLAQSRPSESRSSPFPNAKSRFKHQTQTETPAGGDCGLLCTQPFSLSAEGKSPPLLIEIKAVPTGKRRCRPADRSVGSSGSWFVIPALAPNSCSDRFQGCWSEPVTASQFELTANST